MITLHNLLHSATPPIFQLPWSTHKFYDYIGKFKPPFHVLLQIQALEVILLVKILGFGTYGQTLALL